MKNSDDYISVIAQKGVYLFCPMCILMSMREENQ